MLFVWVTMLLAATVQTAVIVGSPELNTFWETFKQDHNKQYADNEEPMRRLIWEKNIKYIQMHNIEADLGRHTFHLGVNKYADLTEEEYAKFLTGLQANKLNVTKPAASFIVPNNFQAPDMIDWRTKGYVTEVKDQGQCGSCWAFSTTGSLEGQHFRKTGKLVSLSEQNLVDCSKENNGCGGGMMDLAFKYIRRNGGIDTETSYPYLARDGSCHFNRADVGATDAGFIDIRRKDEEALKNAVASVGPVSVAIDASRPTFRFYNHGVYYDPRCSSTRLDHGVLVVGYGVEDGKKYWIVKNSWGPSYGRQGYIMMARDHDNACGIATDASYPTV